MAVEVLRSGGEDVSIWWLWEENMGEHVLRWWSVKLEMMGKGG